jgi:AmiR/NasT family two-component response regulator
VLSARLDKTTDEAFEVLRLHARSARRRLTEVAEEVASGDWTAFVENQRDQ